MKRYKHTAQKLRDLREEAQLSQSELAGRLGLPSQSISNIERGMTGIPKKRLRMFNRALSLDESSTALADAIIDDIRSQHYEHLRPAVPRQFPEHIIEH